MHSRWCHAWRNFDQKWIIWLIIFVETNNLKNEQIHFYNELYITSSIRRGLPCPWETRLPAGRKHAWSSPGERVRARPRRDSGLPSSRNKHESKMEIWSKMSYFDFLQHQFSKNIMQNINFTIIHGFHAIFQHGAVENQISSLLMKLSWCFHIINNHYLLIDIAS